MKPLPPPALVRSASPAPEVIDRRLPGRLELSGTWGEAIATAYVDTAEQWINLGGSGRGVTATAGLLVTTPNASWVLVQVRLGSLSESPLR
jgi:hypothetical protein